MYRRIELINHYKRRDDTQCDFKHGLCGVCNEEVADAWSGLHVPRKNINKNVRFYFTELGWSKFGRQTLGACIRTKQDYRVIAVEEHDVDVLYKDEYQVCVRPKRKR